MDNCMKKQIFTWILPLLGLSSCRAELLDYGAGSVRVEIERGEAWLHDFPLFWGIEKKNAPQIAVWIESPDGEYLGTVYVSHKIATESWQAARGARRPEALPHWCHSRGVRYEDGLYLPTKRHPLADGISGATPRESFSLKVVPGEGLRRFVVKVEVNHSTDFNDAWPRNARPGEPGYSGGKEGSGQPAVVYAAGIDPDAGVREAEAVPVGHSSADGSTGELNPDLSQLTSALRIVRRITVKVL